MCDRVAASVALAEAAELGMLDGLECPECHQHSVIVRFTQPERGVYRQWFLCTRCQFHQRVQLSGRPKYYSDELVDQQLQAHDAEILHNSRFPRPE